MNILKQYSGSIAKFLAENKWLILSCFLNLIIQVIIAVIYFNPIDFVLQVETAREIAQGKVLYRDINQIIYEGSILPNPQYPPLYLYTLAALMFIAGVDAFSYNMVKIFLILVNFIVAFLIYHLINTNYGKIMAILAFNWFLLNPSTLGITLGGYHEYFMLLFVLLAYHCFNHERMTWSGICFGLALLVKPIAGVYIIPILIWGLKKRKMTSIYIGIVASLTFTIVSLPFLLLAPAEYITDVFLVHTNRLDPSMSFYVYIFTDLSPTLFPFILQLLLFSIIGVILFHKIQFKDPMEIYIGVLPFITIFLAFNRILYPHYIPMIFPFITLSLFLLIDRHRHVLPKKNTLWQIYGYIFGLGVVYVGYIWWSILWSMEGFGSYRTNIYFPISAGICIGGLLIITIISLWSIITMASVKNRNEIHV
ncbi:hypothetical protein CEE45_05990 [Candidatus Heimdallarchaeota archaeon B3_Heim]|nr:MAG: hypothetical protein CEE45_05990 [Candidatus Heimdallarchaeota archaeon B3_Heim]